MSEVLYDVPCTLGLEEVLEAEVAAQGGAQVRRRRGGITCRGDRALGYRLCLWARSAIRVQEVLAELPEIFRSVLVLREFEELPYQEIADVLGISIGTVESRLFRARAKFRDKLLSLHPEFGEQA